MFAAPFARWHAIPFCVVLAACGNDAGREPSEPAGEKGGTSGSGGVQGVGGSTQSGGTGGGGASGGLSGGASGTSGAGGGGEPVSVALYEAERAFFTGASTTATVIADFTGSGYVELSAPDRVVFTVHVTEGGAVDYSLRYANPTAASGELALVVNGARTSAIPLEASATAFSPHEDTVTLRPGLNTVAVVLESDLGGAIAIDHLELSRPGSFAARGATVPFIAYEAEDGTTSGTVLGPDRTYGTVAAEASGRRAVELAADGAYVEQTVSSAANALVVRYSTPDAPAGGGLEGSLGVLVDGEKRGSLALSSKYAWLYGAYPYDNDPAHGEPHRYFDEARLLIGDIPAGASVRLQKEDGDAIPYVVDLLELETVGEPLPQPEGSLSIVSYGAGADDQVDDTQAIQAAIADASAQGKDVFIPVGEFLLTSRLDLPAVTLRGAGPWYSVLRGESGKGGFNGTGGQVALLDFALFGDVSYRDDAAFDAGVDGKLGAGSLIQNVWFEHTKVGVWTIGAADTLIVDCRIRDTFADGINFTGGTLRSMVEHVHLRNTGDDALAMWSNGSANQANTYRFNSVSLPILANGIGIYGGNDLRIEDNQIADTVFASAGIAISTRAEFNPLPFGGTTTVERNTLTRTGGYEPNWQAEFGGLWIFANLSAIDSNLVVRDVDILDSTYQGLLLSGEQGVENALFERVTVAGASTFGIEVATSGSATFSDVTVSSATSGGATIATEFQAVKGSGNTGW